MTGRAPLRERKQQRAREQIVRAAFELFAERGFAEVTVADIAERAEVGRTTFFRYFGDKQEVVFADEQDLLDALAERHRASISGTAPDLETALAQIRLAVLAVCAEATKDGEHFRRHERLLRDNPELHDRGNRKLQRFTETVTANLRDAGATPLVAALAPQLALACFNAGRHLGDGDPARLSNSVDAAFTALGAARFEMPRQEDVL
ncbi:TetR/AcrR family transcriptional regulator [Amycolatopsis lurida]